jgi:hypothetical protein
MDLVAQAQRRTAVYLHLTLGLLIFLSMQTVHRQADQLEEIKQLNDGLLTRIEVLERQNHQLVLNIGFNAKHVKVLEETNEAWRTSHGQFQSLEVHYRSALDSARQQLAQCVNR